LDNALYVVMVLSILILLASMISVELGVTVAIVEIALGVVAGNVLGIDPPGWLGIPATFASVVLTFDTISSLYGLNAGIIDQTQFSVLVTGVVLTAILPTIVAQRWFTPLKPAKDQPSWKGQIR
jgi:hypothetical protein